MTNLACDTPVTPLQQVATESDSAKAIRRIDYISRVGVYFLKGGMDETILQDHLGYYALGRYPGTYTGDEKALKEDVHMAIDKAQLEWFEPNKESFADMVRSWVATKERQWSVQNGYAELRLLHPPEKSHFRQIVSRMLKEGKIKRVGNNSGVYRCVDKNMASVDWKAASEDTTPIWLPFELSDKVIIPPGSIILISGSQVPVKRLF